MSDYLSSDDIKKIEDSVSVIDYFLYLEKIGKVNFDRKSGHDYYFINDNSKFSVNKTGYFDFKGGNGEGGKIIKAVMTLENKTWKEALDFLKDFSGMEFQNSILERKDHIKKKFPEENESKTIITNEFKPNNSKLLEYYENRGISKDILEQYTKQVHYQSGEKSYFGIGMENLSKGYEIRNPMMKTKIGKNDISVIEGSKNEMIVFEGMTDTLSFLQLLKDSKNTNNRKLVTLNSIVNVSKFLERYGDFEGKMFLCLDGDIAGDKATKEIQDAFKGKNIKDIRELYHISANENNDLNDYLKNKIKNINLVQENLSKDENNKYNSRQISDSQQVGGKALDEYTNESSEESKSEPGRNNGEGTDIRSKNVGNGLADTIWKHLVGDREPGENKSIHPSQQNYDGENGSRKQLLDRQLENSTNIEELDYLILKYKDSKLSNEQISEVVSLATIVSETNKIELRENLKITDELKDICNQFKSGGIAKQGRGILDEYYTDFKIVDAIRNLIKDQFKNQKEISVLEPSVGTGNFLYATQDLALKSNISAFEINETTAKISKILHTEAEINLRSFETEFIDEKGNKKSPSDFLEKYDLVLGNPPYGEHRGLYKGLGEEPKISKYEDYFVKRSIDSLKKGGILAMVLPSPWISRQKKIQDINLLNAYRLPSGAFAGTQVGTDIIILQKSQNKQVQDISKFFESNPQNVLGEIRQKSNRFGRLENYVHGNLEDALSIIEKIQTKKEEIRIGSLFEDLIPEDIKTSDISAEKKKLSSSDLASKIEETKNSVINAIETLQDRKFRSPALIKEISKYEDFLKKLNKNPNTFSLEKLQELIDKSSKIAKSHQGNSDYEIQKTPLIKKGVLKYQFAKGDEIIDTAIQNKSSISKELVEAFKDTSYDGTINNHGKHSPFANYIDGKWVHDFYYAEGNIYEKLEQLEIDFADKNSIGGRSDQYEKQKELLLSVLPKPKNLENIIISPNHEFVHKFYYGKDEKSTYNYATKDYDKSIEDFSLADKFKQFVGTLPREAFASSSAWEVRSFVDNEIVTGSDKERNALVRERRKAAANDLFSKFIKDELPEEVKERFVKEFNRNYNNIHVPDYSKFPLFSKINKNFKGEELNLTEVQKSGIGRCTTKGVALLAHEVGFGKTLSGVLAMHEAMERGNAKRPIIPVPNSNILKQWFETIFETIPDAKVNVLGNLGKDFDLSKFDIKDGEITLVTYEGFNNIGFSEDITQRLASKFSYISESELKNANSISERDMQIEMQKGKELEGKMKRGKIYDWEDFGFDHLTFDEVHNANHIVGKVKIEDRRFASDFRNQNQQTSKLGINTWMACQYIQDKNDGRNITLLSATPFTNKPLEYYSILSLIANKRLEQSGYFNVNTFFETFMEADNDMEIDAKGDVKFKASVRRFKNNSLFQQLLSEFIDIKGEEDNPELIRPNKINKEYKIEPNVLSVEQYELLNDSFAENEKGAILTHILNARLIAFSPYLSPFYDGLEPSYKFFVEDSPKLNEMMNLIRQNKKDIPEAGQIIYSELAVEEFPKLKDYLVNELGFKNEEVQIITGGTTKNNRIKIQDEFNQGKVKIVIGSEAIQEGMNLQETTSDIYLLTLPYNFTALRQVEGRGWRQGNRNENVRINFMLMNDSIDVFMLQKLQAKQARYLEAMKKGADVVDISDINTLELKTAIITNPVLRAEIEVKLLEKKLDYDKNKLLADNAFILRKYELYTKVVEELNSQIDSYNRTKKWADEETNSSYWKNQLPFYQNKVNNARYEVEKVIENLASKGVDVKLIQNQTQDTDEKIKEIDKVIDGLEDVKQKLVSKYKLEKEENLRKAEQVNIIKEREKENNTLFKKENVIAEKEISNTATIRKR